MSLSMISSSDLNGKLKYSISSEETGVQLSANLMFSSSTNLAMSVLSLPIGFFIFSLTSVLMFSIFSNYKAIFF